MPPPNSLSTKTPRRSKADIRLVALLGASTAIAPFSIDMYLPALPEIGHDFGVPVGQAQFTVAIFFIGIAFGQLLYGPLSDRVGRRGPFLVGLGIYVAASLGCAASDSLMPICIFRFLQAIGGSAGLVISRAVIRDRFAQHEVLQAFAWLTTVMAVSPLLAPLAGGWLLLIASWRWFFLVQAAAAMILATLVWMWLPETRSAATEMRSRGETMVTSYQFLLADRKLRGYLIVGAASGAALYAWVACSADLIINQAGLPATQFGYVFGLNTIGLVLASQINARLARRIPFGTILLWAAFLTTALAAVMLVIAVTGIVGVLGVLIPLFFVIASLGFTQANALMGAINVDPTRSGATASLFGSIGSFAGAGSAALGSVLQDGTPRPLSAIIFVMMFCAGMVARGIRAGPKVS
ncbi:multidrug effflux MFS transporter [soil metagenome]